MDAPRNLKSTIRRQQQNFVHHQPPLPLDTRTIRCRAEYMVAQIMHQRPSGVTAPDVGIPDDLGAARETA